jgi:hypothetical protein
LRHRETSRRTCKWQLALAQGFSRIPECFSHVLGFQVGEIGEDLLDRHAVSKRITDVLQASALRGVHRFAEVAGEGTLGLTLRISR